MPITIKQAVQSHPILPSIFLVTYSPSSPPIQLQAIRFWSLSLTHSLCSRTCLNFFTRYLCQLSISSCSTGTQGGLKITMFGFISEFFQPKTRLLNTDVLICWMLKLYFSQNFLERSDASIFKSILTCTKGCFSSSISHLWRLAEMVPVPEPIQHSIESAGKLWSSCLMADRMRQVSSLGLQTYSSSLPSITDQKSRRSSSLGLKTRKYQGDA